MITVYAKNYTYIPEISLWHIYTHVYMCVYIYIYTHTHTYLIASSNKGLQHKYSYDLQEIFSNILMAL